MRTLTALALMAITIVAAQAQCVLAPETAATRNVESTTAYMLCLQHELAEEARRLAEQMRIDAELNAQRLLLEFERRLDAVTAPTTILPTI
jgi:hypothetical protein